MWVVLRWFPSKKLNSVPVYGGSRCSIFHPTEMRFHNRSGKSELHSAVSRWGYSQPSCLFLFPAGPFSFFLHVYLSLSWAPLPVSTSQHTWIRRRKERPKVNGIYEGKQDMFCTVVMYDEFPGVLGCCVCVCGVAAYMGTSWEMVLCSVRCCGSPCIVFHLKKAPGTELTG